MDKSRIAKSLSRQSVADVATTPTQPFLENSDFVPLLASENRERQGCTERVLENRSKSTTTRSGDYLCENADSCHGAARTCNLKFECLNDILNPEKRIHISRTRYPCPVGGFTFDDPEILRRAAPTPRLFHWQLALKRLPSQLPDVIGHCGSPVKDYLRRRLTFTLG
jgi:hypothetical protein